MQWASLAEQPNLGNAGNKTGPEKLSLTFSASPESDGVNCALERTC
jgi:hypothetical protein